MRPQILRSMVMKSGLYPDQLAKAFGISEHTWRNWMRYPERFLTLEKLIALREILHMNDIELLELIKGERRYEWEERR